MISRRKMMVTGAATIVAAPTLLHAAEDPEPARESDGPVQPASTQPAAAHVPVVTPDGSTLPLAPECAVAEGIPQPPGPNNVFVPAGATVTGPAVTSRRTVKFQCCIHPWMKAEVTGK